MSDLLTTLNDQQRQVVLTTEGPVLVLAGAGSGKTRVLTHRIAYLLAQRKAHPEEIMAVTFTNKAAQEMRGRVTDLLHSQIATPSAIGTFHSLGARLLRTHWRHTQRSASFTILDSGDSERLVKRALEAAQVSSKEWGPKAIRHEISQLKNRLLTPADVAAATSSRREDVVARAFAHYEQQLRDHDAYDFDDLLVALIRLLQEHEPVRRIYQERWRYLSVDEYQDTNAAQEQLLQLMLNPARNLCVVGDDYQAIYSWRGAKVDHILSFEQRFPQCTTIYLTQNYRSTSAILQAAQAVITQNHDQKHKQLWTQQKTGAPVRLFALPSDRYEAAWIREQIENHTQRGGQARDCVVLYRTNAQSRLLEEQCMMHHIPYTIVGGFRFYDRLEVKDAMALLQWWVNPQAQLAITRLAHSLLPGIGPKTLARLQAGAAAAQRSLEIHLQQPGALTPRQQQIFAPLLRAYASARSKQFASVAKLLKHLLAASGYEAYLHRQPDGEERWENIEELLNVAALSQDVTTFVEGVALLSSMDEQAGATDRVLCMTLHAAKGLEFERVFIIGCEEGLLPHSNSLDMPGALEEERRLLYVGMTRARQQLTLSYATTRTLHGETSSQLASRFLEDIPATVTRLDAEVSLPASPWQEMGLGVTTEGSDVTMVPFEPGHYITHPTFGRGIVIQTSGSLLTCVFPTYGVKTIDGTALNATSNL